MPERGQDVVWMPNWLQAVVGGGGMLICFGLAFYRIMSQ